MIRTLVNTALGLVVIAIVGAVVVVPALLGGGRYSVISGSMSPTIKTGDLVVTQRTSPAEIEPQDIIVFKQNETDTVHRVITKVVKADGQVVLTTKGDDNSHPDGELNNNAIQGKVLFTLAQGGELFSWLQAHIWAPIAAVALWYGANVLIDRRASRKAAPKARRTRPAVA
ncbi:MAG: signal peptidase I [Propionibacteriaceae bacterium]|nr:signal peptidase I [Propionibacteriaceae bacterium]